MQILLASNNKHKQRELQQIFDSQMPGFIDLVTPDNVYCDELEVVEDGDDYEENALKKASAYFQKTNIQSIADDSGLEIAALGGKPGVHSARFAGEQRDDAANRQKALELLKDVPDNERTALFRAVFCFKSAAGVEYCEGFCQGVITREERGEGGFGYDSIFIPEGFDETFAEMEPELKNAISHRSMAAANLVGLLMKTRF